MTKEKLQQSYEGLNYCPLKNNTSVGKPEYKNN